MSAVQTPEKPKKKKHPNWGGRRPGAGRPPSGILKKKVSVSVSAKQFEQALELWGGKASHLVDKLVGEYVDREGDS